MKVAVVGAGIVGTCAAWALAKKGCDVTLYERDVPMAHTSRSSSKLLHGGLRYLETAQFSLVKESLIARRHWLEQAPHLCQPLELLFPIYVYEDGGRPKWQIGVGTKLYDFLARGSGFPRSYWIDAKKVLSKSPELKNTGLIGAYVFYDAQMDDYALGLWVIEQARNSGVQVISSSKIENFSQLSDFDKIVNATGPWVMSLRQQQKAIPARYNLDWVRGSHILLKRTTKQALILPIPCEKRIFFVLPYKHNTLIGTTEVRQQTPESQSPSEEEINYLINAYNTYHQQEIKTSDVLSTFSGVRPLIKSAANPSDATRKWAFEMVENVLHVYGGKWTTAQIQGECIAKELLK